jgi:S-adenosylmethionine-diacylglycerol 3-amino-3-carboxypropyl transferase
MNPRDQIFQAAFSKLFVYNILFEDAEVDEAALDLDERATVLSVTGAGCSVASMIHRRPASLDAVDINPHHLALSAFKITAAQRVEDYLRFYDLMGHGVVPDPAAAVAEVAQHMPDGLARYWRRHSGRFAHNLYGHGLMARFATAIRALSGVGSEWLVSVSRQEVADRVARVDAELAPAFELPIVRAFSDSPLQLVFLGINYTQRDRVLAAEGQPDMLSVVLEHIRRLCHTDLETNWIVWLIVTGRYNHARPDAVPPYLRHDRHARSVGAPTRVRYHDRNLFEVLKGGGARTWSHYTLCDMPDWLTPPQQRHLLSEIARTSRDGALVLYRTVEDDCMVDRAGMNATFRRLDAESARATAADRSRQYRHVHLYRVERPS